MRSQLPWDLARFSCMFWLALPACGDAGFALDAIGSGAPATDADGAALGETAAADGAAPGDDGASLADGAVAEDGALADPETSAADGEGSEVAAAELPGDAVNDAVAEDGAADVVAVDAGPDGASGDAASDGAGGDAAATLPDPNADGPYKIAEFDAKNAFLPLTGDTIAMHCAYPVAGPTPGPYPIVVIAHGFQLSPSKYYGYAKRLATFGYVAVTADFPTSLTGNDNPAEAKDLSATIDWAYGESVLAGKVDKTKAGVTGHSLGGKVALLAATLDARFQAVFALDPVDGGGPTGCKAPQCVDVSALMPTLKIPSAFLGETTDANGGFQPCAPAANNFTTFYKGAPSPALQVTVNGANHMSFLDDTNNCMACGFCNKATASQSQVLALSRAMMVAFFERRLRGLTAYDDYLTGPTAQARYVKTQWASIEAK